MSAAVAYLPVHYPALEQMGVTRFDEISGYSLRQAGADKDILKVHYKREKGSLLPVTRKYKFGRSPQTFLTDGGSARTENIFEISPFLLRAVSELDTLTSQREETIDKRALLLAELAELEKNTEVRIAAIREQLQGL